MFWLLVTDMIWNLWRFFIARLRIFTFLVFVWNQHLTKLTKTRSSRTHRNAQKLCRIHRCVNLISNVLVVICEVFQSTFFAFRSFHGFIECECNTPNSIVGKWSFLISLWITIMFNIVSFINKDLV